MKKQITIILALLWIIPSFVMAQLTGAQSPTMGYQAPSASFHSTGSAMMTSGSTYTPAVYEVGSSSPHSAPGIRRTGGPGSVTPGTTADDDPENTQIGSLDDAVLPLLLMALAFAGYVALRRRKINNQESRINNQESKI